MPVRWIHIRLHLVAAIFVLAWAAIIWRAFDLGLVQRERLAEMADREGYKVVRLLPIRGEILDRNNEALAVSLETDSVFAEPNKIDNPEEVARTLAPILGLERKKLAQDLTGKGSFTWVKRLISPEQSKQIRALDLPGIDFVKERKRFYPNNLLAGHVLGFVGVDSNGLEGVELGCDEYLRGGVNEWRVRRDARGRTILDRDIDAPRINRGDNVTLTIDRRIQFITEQVLEKAVADYKAKAGLALVMRPDTGEILASAVAPGFNPNVYNLYSAARRRNRVVTDTFDPGSTFKVFVVAGALEDAVVTPDESVFCENGLFRIGGRTIHDHHKYGWLTVSEVIQHSSNIGTVKISNKLGPAQMYRYLTAFSFGRRMGLDFPGEASGLVRPYTQWQKIDTANVAFGQGVSVTALQMTAAMSAIANKGVLMRPYIVSRITDADGQMIRRNAPQPVGRVVSARTAAALAEMLRLVVQKGGTGVKADSAGWPAAGKTGTAQKLDSETGAYSDEKYFSSFLGYVPFENPRMVIFVGLDEPSGGRYGGDVAAPAFREIAERTLPLLNAVPASTVLSAEAEAVPPVSTDAMSHPEPNRLSVKLDAATMAAIQTLTEDIRKTEGLETVPEPQVIRDAEGRLVMPNLVGLSMRKVLDLMGQCGVDLTFSGSGQAVWQAPSPGEAVTVGQTCSVRFAQW